MFGSNYASNMVSIPVGQTHIISSVSVFINAPGMMYVLTSIMFLEMMIQYSNIDYVVMVGDIVYSFVL